jgi:tripeptide aminopeptidase
MSLPKLKYSVTERFLRYVQIDTQSDPESNSVPTTMKQKDLGKLLVEELQALGISDAHLDELGYVYATIPANVDGNIPVICFCSHMDTAPDCSGAGVVPIIHRNYQGQPLILPKDNSQILTIAEHPVLGSQIGNDIITGSGDTLLGADNKAGVAEIMDACQQFVNHPEIKHGKIRILFTPDEEVGRGVDHVDMVKLGADFGYTMDGATAGEVEDENFNAYSAVISINGVSAHPGYAKGKMQNAIKILSDIIALLPKETMSPESTEGREAFIHPTYTKANLENAEIGMILRSFEKEGIQELMNKLNEIIAKVGPSYPDSKVEITFTEQYRNMKEILDQHPEVVKFAVDAVIRSGLTPIRTPIRGGTDGARLSFMGLPCPNIFAGEHAFHGKQEWVSVQDMEAAVDTILHIASIWAEDRQN